MTIDVAPPEALGPSERAAWSALQDADPALWSPFLSPEWPLAVAQAAPRRDHSVRVAIARESGRPAAFLSARVNGLAAAPAGAPLCDHQGLVSAPDFRTDLRAFVRAFGVGRLDFQGVPVEQPAFTGWSRGTETAFSVDLSGGYAAWAEGLRASGSDLVKDVAKKRRKLEREHGPVVFSAMSSSSSDFEALIAWKRRQYRATRQTDIFEAGWPLELLRRLFETRDPCFGGALFTLHAGDQLVGAHFALRGWRVLHAWFIAHDEAYGRYSPGFLLFDDILRWMDGGPHARLDLGPGGFGFKHRLANVERQVGYGFVGLPSAATLVRSAQYGLRDAVEALPLPAVSALPGKAMRRMDLIRALR